MENRLYAITAGMAANSPIAVAISASAMPGATVAIDTLCIAPSERKEFMMPQTVPNNPTYGLVEPTVARKESRGAHYREDCPERDDKNFLKHTFATMDAEGNIDIQYADVTLGKFEPQERKY